MPHPFSPPLRRTVRAVLLFAAVVFAADLVSAQEAKRPLRHTDYDGWKTIQSTVLSRDGNYLAYNLLPGDGDGEFIVRNLTSNAEHRVPRGKTAVAFGAGGGDDVMDDDQPGPRAGAGPARRGQRPGRGAAPVHAGQQAHHLPLAADARRHREGQAGEEETRGDAGPRRRRHGPGDRQDHGSPRTRHRLQRRRRRGRGPALQACAAKAEDKAAPATPPSGEGKGATTPARTYGTDLVIRNLADDFERVIPDVAEYTVTRDGKMLVYVVSSKKEENNGVYAIRSCPAARQCRC